MANAVRFSKPIQVLLWSFKGYNTVHKWIKCFLLNGDQNVIKKGPNNICQKRNEEKENG